MATGVPTGTSRLEPRCLAIEEAVAGRAEAAPHGLAVGMERAEDRVDGQRRELRRNFDRARELDGRRRNERELLLSRGRRGARALT